MGRTIIKNSVIITVVFLSMFILAGCVGFLEIADETIRPHEVAPYEPQPTELIVVSNYEELVAAVIELVTQHETEAQIQFHYHDDDDIQNEIDRARNQILNEHPLGAFALADITFEVTRIVMHYDIDIEIIFERTEEQINSIANISTQRHMMTHLLDVMREYEEEAIIRTRLPVTVEEINQLVREAYYQHPRYIVMLPFVAVDAFPQEGEDRIFEIRFAYTAVNANILPELNEELAYNVQRSAELVVGYTDSERLLSLVNILIDSVTFDEVAPVHSHGAQNFSATAFGALVHGMAVGEGFAMAFQAIADELGLYSHIVLGYFEGRVHAWNIVLLYGDFYHVDVAMAVVNGIETAIMKRDADFEEMMYNWDRENTVKCEGELTLEDILAALTDDDLDDIVGNGDENGEEG